MWYHLVAVVSLITWQKSIISGSGAVSKYILKNWPTQQITFPSKESHTNHSIVKSHQQESYAGIKKKVTLYSFFFISSGKKLFSLLYAYIFYCSFLLFFILFFNQIFSLINYAYRQYMLIIKKKWVYLDKFSRRFIFAHKPWNILRRYNSANRHTYVITLC